MTTAAVKSYPDFWTYFKGYWLKNEQAIRWGYYYPYLQTSLSSAEIEQVKAHDTNAFSEGRNSADRRMFNFEVRKTKNSSSAKLQLVEQVSFAHIITKRLLTHNKLYSSTVYNLVYKLFIKCL